MATQERILNELERHNAALDKHITEDKQLEKRIDRIETKQAYATGIIVALVGIFSLTSDLLLTKLGLK